MADSDNGWVRKETWSWTVRIAGSIIATLAMAIVYLGITVIRLDERYKTIGDVILPALGDLKKVTSDIQLKLAEAEGRRKP